MARTPRTAPADPAIPAAEPEGVLLHLPLADVVASPDNPRADLAIDDEFVDSIRRHGVIEPLIVIPAEDGRFTVVAGHRRLAGAIAAGALVVPAVVRDLQAVEVDAIRLIENLHRADLTPVDEARAFQRLIDVHGWKQTDIAEAISRNQGHVSKRLKLLSLLPDALALVEDGSVSLEQGVELARLPAVVQDAALQRMGEGVVPEAAIRIAVAQVADLKARGAALKSAKAAGVPLIELEAGVYVKTDRIEGPWPLVWDATAADAHRVAWTAGTRLACETFFVAGGKGYGDNIAGLLTWDGYDRSWILGPYCTDPSSHRTVGADDAPVAVPAASTEQQVDWEARRAEKEALTTARAAATDARRVFLATVVATMPKNVESYLAAAAALDGFEVEYFNGDTDLELACQLLGDDVDGRSDVAVRAWAARLTGAQAVEVRRAAFALRLARGEAYLKQALIETHLYQPVGYCAGAHVMWLRAWGYDATPEERAIEDRIGTLVDVATELVGDESAVDLDLPPAHTITATFTATDEPGSDEVTTTAVVVETGAPAGAEPTPVVVLGADTVTRVNLPAPEVDEYFTPDDEPVDVVDEGPDPTVVDEAPEAAPAKRSRKAKADVTA